MSNKKQPGKIKTLLFHLNPEAVGPVGLSVFTSSKVRAESFWRKAAAADSFHVCTSTIRASSRSRGSRWTWTARPRNTRSERLFTRGTQPLAWNKQTHTQQRETSAVFHTWGGEAELWPAAAPPPAATTGPLWRRRSGAGRSGGGRRRQTTSQLQHWVSLWSVEVCRARGHSHVL